MQGQREEGRRRQKGGHNETNLGPTEGKDKTLSGDKKEGEGHALSLLWGGRLSINKGILRQGKEKKGKRNPRDPHRKEIYRKE